MKKDVLFICVHNSARSQMAEEYVKLLSDGRIDAESAGFEPRVINPLVIQAMQEEGVDLSDKETQSVFELFRKGHTYGAVITVCDESEGGNCPIFPGLTHRLHLPFPDPSKLEGTDEEKLAKIREIRDGIKNLMKDFVVWYENPEKGKLAGRWEIKDIARTEEA
ncbi:MAG: arsenate reductase ArsC [Oceanidesulfovibrio sp.]